MYKILLGLVIVAVCELGCRAGQLTEPKDEKLPAEFAAEMERLITKLRDRGQTEQARAEAGEKLVEIADKRALELLIEALRDKDGHVRTFVALALGNTRDKRAIKPLVAALRDASGLVSFSIVGAIIAIGNGQTVEFLVPLLEDKDLNVRLAASSTLAVIGDEKAVGPLIGVLKDKNEDVRKNAVTALTRIAGKDFGEDYEKWKQWYENNKDK